MASNAVVPFEHQLTLAESIAKSGMFGIKTRDQALVLMALCEAENLHPIVAVRDFNIIQGRPALKADAMLTRFQASGGKVRWLTYTDNNVTGEFSHPSGGTITVDWTTERAKQAGLGGKGPWLQYPRAMLRARVISEAIRSVFPGVLSGLYTPEEVSDMAPQPRDVTPKPEARKPADDLAAFAGENPPAADPPQAAYDADTGEVADKHVDTDADADERPHRIALEVADGVANWSGFCSDYNDALMAAEDEDTLLAIVEQNKDTIMALSSGGKGGRAAAERLRGTFTGCQIELRRRTAAA